MDYVFVSKHVDVFISIIHKCIVIYQEISEFIVLFDLRFVISRLECLCSGFNEAFNDLHVLRLEELLIDIEDDAIMFSVSSFVGTGSVIG